MNTGNLLLRFRICLKTAIEKWAAHRCTVWMCVWIGKWQKLYSKVWSSRLQKCYINTGYLTYSKLYDVLIEAKSFCQSISLSFPWIWFTPFSNDTNQPSNLRVFSVFVNTASGVSVLRLLLAAGTVLLTVAKWHLLLSVTRRCFCKADLWLFSCDITCP